MSFNTAHILCVLLWLGCRLFGFKGQPVGKQLLLLLLLLLPAFFGEGACRGGTLKVDRPIYIYICILYIGILYIYMYIIYIYVFKYIYIMCTHVYLYIDICMYIHRLREP